jgi:outer membrane protein OmpA-like peptidoglycan-associated protein
MHNYDIRQDKPYRRGLVLGLTMAEIMILLIFVLLMALASALANRDKRIQVLSDGVGSRLVEAIQKAYPEAKTSDDYYKELVRAIDARKMVDSVGTGHARQQILQDAELGHIARQQAKQIKPDSLPAFLAKAIAQANAGRKGQWPPFFSLSEAGGYYFESGKATLRPDFVLKLKTSIIPLLKKYAEDYGVDVIEVTGHTDEVPMAGESNLDDLLIEASVNRVPIESLQSTDNAGLAIARAVSVVHILRADPRLTGITILPLSGAQLIVPVDRPADGTATQSDQTRRRIEIRLRRSTPQVTSLEDQ